MFLGDWGRSEDLRWDLEDRKKGWRTNFASRRTEKGGQEDLQGVLGGLEVGEPTGAGVDGISVFPPPPFLPPSPSSAMGDSDDEYDRRRRDKFRRERSDYDRSRERDDRRRDEWSDRWVGVLPACRGRPYISVGTSWPAGGALISLWGPPRLQGLQ